MIRGWLALACLCVVGACVQSPSAGVNRPSVQATSGPAVTPTVSPAAAATASPSPSPSPTPDLPVSQVGFSCRLPVIRYTSGGDFVQYQGGFITFPQGISVTDPAGVIFSEYLQEDLVTKATPQLHGTGGPFYDLAMKRWVPSAPGLTSPDGSHYAYSRIGASSTDPVVVHIVDVAHGSESTVSVTMPAPAAAVGAHVVDFDGASVYLVSDQFERFPMGVWRLDLATGTLHQLTDVGGVILVRNGVVWAGSIDPRDPNPPRPPRSGELFDTLLRLDLATGKKTTWYYAPGKAVALRGLDSSGLPVIATADGPDYDYSHGPILLIPAPGDPGRQIVPPGNWFSDPQADHGRLWFGNDRGIYLYTSGGGFQKVFAFSGDQTTSESLQPVGFCL